MDISLGYNSYNILGLSSNTDQRLVTKRYKEISNQLKIGLVPKYDIDIPACQPARNEQTINDAVQKLQSPRNRISEYFLWFTISDEIDRKAIELVRESRFYDAIQVWQENISTKTCESYFYKKNLALLYYIILFNRNDKSYIASSINLWHELVFTNKYWDSFFLSYETINGQSTSKEIYETFKSNVIENISTMYTELSTIHNEPLYVSSYYKIFSHKGGYLEDNVLAPIYGNINDCIEKLNLIEISSIEDYSKSLKIELKVLIKSIQSNLNSLKDLGLYNDSISIVLRDKASEALRSISIDLHNNLDIVKKSKSITKEAIKIAGTTSLIERLENDLSTMKMYENNEIIIGPVNELIDQEKYSDAIEYLESINKSNEVNDDLQKQINLKLRKCAYSLAGRKWMTAHEELDKKLYNKSRDLFRESGNLIYKYIELFDFNKSAIDKMIAEINFTIVNCKSINDLYEYRTQYINIAKEKFKDTLEELALIIIFDGHLHDKLCGNPAETKLSEIIEKIFWGIKFVIAFGLMLIGFISSFFES